MRAKTRIASLGVALIACLLVVGGCERLKFQQPELLVPSAEEAAEFYENFDGITTVELSGNVVVLHVEQPVSQLRRGGSLWAKVGPYIYLLSPSTKELLETYAGVAAVRVITHTARNEEVARAMLLRDGMSDYQWQRSQHLLGLALREGTKTPARLTDLVRWGEQYTEFNYSPAYVKQ